MILSRQESQSLRGVITTTDIDTKRFLCTESLSVKPGWLRAVIFLSLTLFTCKPNKKIMGECAETLCLQRDVLFILFITIWLLKVERRHESDLNILELDLFSKTRVFYV